MLVLVHETPNRMRFNGAIIKNNPRWAAFLENVARASDSVTDVRASTLTGSLTIHHRSDPDMRALILEQLGEYTDIVLEPAHASSGQPEIGLQVLSADSFARTVMDALIQCTVSRIMDAVIAGVL